MSVPFDRIQITPVSPALGAEISGVDISKALDDLTVAEIRAALLEYLVVFFATRT